jgi:hypothetical protein
MSADREALVNIITSGNTFLKSEQVGLLMTKYMKSAYEQVELGMSHVTRHTSHVTRHTSHVTRHTSHVTRHTSHVTPTPPGEASHAMHVPHRRPKRAEDVD